MFSVGTDGKLSMSEIEISSKRIAVQVNADGTFEMSGGKLESKEVHALYVYDGTATVKGGQILTSASGGDTKSVYVDNAS